MQRVDHGESWGSEEGSESPVTCNDLSKRRPSLLVASLLEEEHGIAECMCTSPGEHPVEQNHDWIPQMLWSLSHELALESVKHEKVDEHVRWVGEHGLICGSVHVSQ